MNSEQSKDYFEKGNLKLYRMDCMELMKDKPDKFYDLAIVDPPFGIGLKFSTKDQKEWNNKIPDMNYFNELIRVSKEQIIWGISYYPKMPNDKGGRIVWYKEPSMNNKMNISDCDIAFYSKHKRIGYFHYQYYGNVENGSIDWKGYDRIHPTQKPVQLYKWCLEQYARPGNKILDTHLGSGSSAIAAYYFDCEFTGTELDKDYFRDSINRVDQQTNQLKLL